MATSKPITKAVFPVAGLDTRFLPATKAVPKELLPIVDRPLLRYAVDEAREAGIEQMIFVTGHGESAIVEHFDRAFELEATMAERGKDMAVLDATHATPGDIIGVRQQVPLGLGHAIWCARGGRRRTLCGVPPRRVDGAAGGRRNQLHGADGRGLCPSRRQSDLGARGPSRAGLEL